MKKRRISAVLAAVPLVAVLAAVPSARKDKDITVAKDGTRIVNTTRLARDVKGYAGQTPLKVYARDGRIVKVEALPNNETAGIFARVRSQLLGRWTGMEVSAAASADIDGVSGATYSSRAVKENVKRAARALTKAQK
jgi:Na+-translocating ferredoxin:NAD+ oxidoreductase subunit G